MRALHCAVWMYFNEIGMLLVMGGLMQEDQPLVQHITSTTAVAVAADSGSGDGGVFGERMSVSAGVGDGCDIVCFSFEVRFFVIVSLCVGVPVVVDDDNVVDE